MTHCRFYIIFPHSLDGGRNSGVEVGWQFLLAFRAPTVGLNAALETRQTDNVLTRQDGRLFELREANRARNAKPAQKHDQVRYLLFNLRFTPSMQQKYCCEIRPKIKS